MKLYSTNRINALGLKGPEETYKYFPKAKFIEVDNGNIQESEKILYNKSKEIFSKNEGQIFIGGDHSITYPIFKAFQEKNKNPFLIVFDAHADCMPPQQEPTHEEFLRAIVEDGFPPEKIILIGTRKIEPEEEKFLKEKRIKVFRKLPDINSIPKDHNIYLSIDIDVLDPIFAPAVNYPEPDGLKPKELFEILKKLNPNTLDIVEAIPKKDNPQKLTIKLISKIIEETNNL